MHSEWLFLDVCIILNAEWNWDMLSDLVFNKLFNDSSVYFCKECDGEYNK